MKQSSLVNSCLYSKIFRFTLFLISFCIFFATTTHAQVVHRRLWPWPSRPWPYRPYPWMEPPKPGPPPPKPSPQPNPAPCPPIPPKPKPPPSPAPICPPIQPKPKPPPAPCPPLPPKPQPKPPPAPSPKPPKPPGPTPKPKPPPTPSPKPPPPKPPSPSPKPSPPKPPKPSPPKPPKPSPPKPPKPSPPKPPSPSPKPSPPKPQNKTIPAVFFFGDSIFDTGNNNNLDTRIKSNYRPYGMDFPMGVATGRFSNGRVASDYIAKYLGVKDVVPAYFDQKLKESELQQSDLLTGVSFASGGAGYEPATSESLKVIPMLDQLKYFQDYKERLKKLVGKKKTKRIVSKGVAVVVAGGNDLINGRRDKDNVDGFTSVMADSAASFVLQLYGYGVRRIGVIGTPPLGCTPVQRVKKKKICNQELNYASQLFNSKLFIILGQMSKTLPNSTLVYMDIYSIFSQMLESPLDYGFEEIKKPCCKVGILGGGVFCKKSTTKICPNTSSYMFWDGLHPTQRAFQTANKLLVKQYLRYL